MKTRVFYFALAVAAAAIASSCVKEQAEPMDPEAEITGQVFEASHEVITKSTLVDLTPTWVEGDQISVSGSDETLVCTFVKGTENKFQTEEGGAVESPFYAIYPAADGHSVDRATGVFTATVPSLQKIDVTKGQNVAPGALVAVAQSETHELQFKNAVGLVKINIARNDIMAVKIEGLGENEFVAGQFTMKLNGDKEPEIALVEGTGVTSVTLNTVENYGMFTPGEYYATVLPCNLSGIKVTFSRKTFKYGENGEVTGTGSETTSVQKQSSTEIKRNAGTNLGTFFTYEISTADELLAWNKADAKWTVWDVVTLKDNIDCSTIGSSWTPKEFKGVFDGNGKTIDNFVIEKEGHAAFFRKLQGATVQDLTFGEGCSFTSTAPVGDVVYAASLAGEVRGGVTITNVTNYGDVRISQNATSGAKGDYLGGICAYFLADSDSQMTGCKNYGDLTYSAKAAGTVYCGGLTALAATKVGLTMIGCENHGTVLFDGVNDAKVDVNLGGIAAIANTVNFDSCVNLGAVKSGTSTTVTGATNIGGIVGFMNNACGTIQNCVNGSSADASKGALTNDSPASGVVRIGGFVGSIISKPINVTGFKNYGPVTNNGAVSNWTALGGVVGNIGGIADVNTVSGCENHGEVVNTKVASRVSLGGVVGMIQKANTVVTGNSNAGKVTNTGDAPAGNGVTLGGVVGRIEASTNGENTLEGNTNSGDVIFDAAGAEDGTMLSGVAGILGGHAGNIVDKVYQPCKLTIDNCSNSGKVEKIGAGASRMYVGGIAAFLNGLENNDTYVSDVSGCTNNGAVLNGSSGAGEWSIFTGGIVGYYRVNGTLKGCVNNGSVTNTSSAQYKNSFKHFRLGGIVGSAENGTITDCTNNGEVKDASETNAGCVGGIVGYASTKAITLTNCDNKNSVTVSFNSAADPYPMAIGGVLGYADEAVTLDGCDNTGDVTNYRTTTALNIYMGGLVGQMLNKSLTVKNCKMSGTLTNNASGGKATLGAVVGICYDNTISDTHSTMDVNNTYANQYIGGFIGQVEANKTTNISNCSVAADVVSSGAGYSGMFVGRLTDKAADGLSTTLTNIWVKGSFEGIDLTAENYTDMCFGTGSDYEVTDNIQYGDFK